MGEPRKRGYLFSTCIAASVSAIVVLAVLLAQQRAARSSNAQRRMLTEVNRWADALTLEPIPYRPYGAKDKEAMHAWLEKFHARDIDRLRGDPRQRATFPPDARAALDLTHPCGVIPGRAPLRQAVVVLPAGDTFNASSWTPDPATAPFDLVLLHYGSNPPRCPHCVLVMNAKGAKWKLARDFALSEPWRRLQGAKGYKHIMVADDDLELSQCTIGTAFAAARAYRLTLAQPSLCQAPNVFSPYSFLYRFGNDSRSNTPTHHPNATALRLVNFVEVMAPIFDMSFWEGAAVPSLFTSYYGTGMDSVWPTLLQYPTASIGVVDAACMYHYAKPEGAPKLLYAVPTPFLNKTGEEAVVWREYGIKRNLGWVKPHLHANITWSQVESAAKEAKLEAQSSMLSPTFAGVLGRHADFVPAPLPDWKILVGLLLFFAFMYLGYVRYTSAAASRSRARKPRVTWGDASPV